MQPVTCDIGAQTRRDRTAQETIPGSSRQSGNYGGDRASAPLRKPADSVPQDFTEQVARITAKQFVAAVSGKRNRDVLALQARDQQPWNLRGVRKWLIVNLRQSGYHRGRFPGRHI